MTERRETGRSKRPRSRHKPRSKPVNRQGPSETGDGERIAKYLARCGVASRRASETLIAEGKVFVNGERLITPAVKVTGREDIRVAGKRIQPPEATRLWRYHKPAGLITTNSDPAGRRTIFDELPKSLPRTVTIGRLDLNTEGLLLLTNNGELARALELPDNGMDRTYRARAHGDVSEELLASLSSGITVDGEIFGSIKAELERTMGHNSWLTVTLREGKKREVRRALEAIGLKVNRLIRTNYGPFELGELRPGSVKEVPEHRVLKDLGSIHPPLRNELVARSRFERQRKTR
ncbi:MAG: pseudouridine synthase [Pseudomonadota bacterium]